jgi:IS4 transposase
VDNGVLKDEWVLLPIRTKGKIVSSIKLRRIAYWDNANQRVFAFLTNINEKNMDGGKIAQLYKQRWKIELLFKQLKQNFPL